MTAEAGARPPARRITLAQLALLTPVVVVIIGSFRAIRDNSFLWHVAAGRLQVADGSVLTADPFSFTMAGEPWRTQSWLADVLYAWIEDTGGLTGFAWMLLVAGLLTFGGVALLAWVHSHNVWATAAVTLLSVPLLVPVMVPRPVVFTLPLFALVILAWEDRRLRWALPFLFWLWASVHGSFFLGLAYVGLRLLAKREWKALGVPIVAAVATLATAHGLGVIGIVIEFVTARPHLSFITEWRTPDFLSFPMLPFVGAIFLLLWGAMRGRLVPADLWVVVPFVLLALSATRAVAPSWIALTPVLARALGWKRVEWGRGFPVPVAALFAVVVVAMPLLFVEKVEIDPRRFPLAAVPHLDPTLRTFHDDVSGGYFIYEDLLDHGVFIDDRVELFMGRIDEFMDIRAGKPVWREVLERDGIEQVLVGVNEPLRQFLEDEDWQTFYRDERYAVLRPH